MNPENPPAFPIPDSVHPNGQVRFGTDGMTLRDYFAIRFAANTELDEGAHTPQDMADAAYARAKFAYVCADAMLAARGKEPTR